MRGVSPNYSPSCPANTSPYGPAAAAGLVKTVVKANYSPSYSPSGVPGGTPASPNYSPVGSSRVLENAPAGRSGVHSPAYSPNMSGG